MDDSCGLPGAEDPEIAAILDFEPVDRRNKRGDGWTAPLQRLFIAELARHGSPGKACDALGKHRSGIDKVYKARGADSFRAAWAKAVDIAERRAAERIAAELEAVAGLTMPFVDNRRRAKAAPPDGPGAAHGDDGRDCPDLLYPLFAGFVLKVRAERRARLSGRIAEADFYLRQISFFEVAIDLADANAVERLAELRRGGHGLLDIAETDLSRFLDEARRLAWQAESDAGAVEPPRPRPPDHLFDDHGGYRSEPGELLGRDSRPAPGCDPQSWRGLAIDQQAARFKESYRRAAEEQIAYEQAAYAAWLAGSEARRPAAALPKPDNDPRPMTPDPEGEGDRR